MTDLGTSNNHFNICSLCIPIKRLGYLFLWQWYSTIPYLIFDKPVIHIKQSLHGLIKTVTNPQLISCEMKTQIYKTKTHVSKMNTTIRCQFMSVLWQSLWPQKRFNLRSRTHWYLAIQSTSCSGNSVQEHIKQIFWAKRVTVDNGIFTDRPHQRYLNNWTSFFQKPVELKILHLDSNPSPIMHHKHPMLSTITVNRMIYTTGLWSMYIFQWRNISQIYASIWHSLVKCSAYMSSLDCWSGTKSHPTRTTYWFCKQDTLFMEFSGGWSKNELNKLWVLVTITTC